MSLFVMKGVAPKTPPCRNSIGGPAFLGCNVIVMILLFILPGIALWLPKVIR
jgi:TRAP-type mannitol/chloroaromatic compound transport system permease large subunit